MQKLKVALVAYGMSGKVFHAPLLEQNPGFELLGAWERSKKSIRADYSTAKSYGSFRELLDADPDLVVVNTPVETHFKYAKEALLAGKHVLVEKAFTTTTAEAEELRDLATSKNLTLAVFHNRRWDSDFRTVEDMLRKNILGDIVEAEIHFDRYRPTLSPKQHKESANPGAGILMDLGSHIIDQALVLFGFPEAVSADIRVTREGSIVNDWLDITLFYPTLRVRLKAGFFVREPLPAYILHGKYGSFLKSRADVQESDLSSGKKPELPDWGTEPAAEAGLLHTEFEGILIREKVPALSGNYCGFFDKLHQSILNKTAPPVTADEGISVMRIIEAAFKSNEQQQRITL